MVLTGTGIWVLVGAGIIRVLVAAEYYSGTSWNQVSLGLGITIVGDIVPVVIPSIL